MSIARYVLLLASTLSSVVFVGTVAVVMVEHSRARAAVVIQGDDCRACALTGDTAKHFTQLVADAKDDGIVGSCFSAPGGPAGVHNRLSSPADSDVPLADFGSAVDPGLRAAPFLGEFGNGALTPRKDEDLQALADVASGLCGFSTSAEKALFRRLISRESAWDPNAVSSSGAIGLGQLIPSTLAQLSPTLDIHDPFQNLVGSACLLRQLYEREGSWERALWSYHAGPNRKTTSSHTKAYAATIIGDME